MLKGDYSPRYAFIVILQDENAVICLSLLCRFDSSVPPHGSCILAPARISALLVSADLVVLQSNFPSAGGNALTDSQLCCGFAPPFNL
jgi:hypothetical protein